MADIDAGVIATVADEARFEVFDEFLDHAEYYLKGKKVAQAGVIGGVVFEDTIRRTCDKLGITQRKVDLDLLITELAKRDVLKPPMAKRARAAADVRTQASHAQWDQFGHSDVETTIKLTRELMNRLLE